MALPSCPKCDNRTFSLEEISPARSNYKFSAICCSHCGAIAGVVDFFNIGQLIHNLAKKLGVSL